ncbi:hypothetical protein BurJ1DRAFT_0812 [Burkholderiales bacterium JOSHI_001]|nr:hypothetical protein BurJ1DRAFT_0812 [Burkholderiales bacterium JOSHI_001]
MKKTLITLALLGAASLSQAAEGWKFLPIVNDPAYKMAPTVALTVDRVDPKESGASTLTNYGVEFNFNCALIQDPNNRIRTALKLHRGKEDGVTATAFELSPRYMLPVGSGVSVGAGPSLVWLKLSDATDSQRLFGAGVALAAEWRSGALFVGTDLRWHDLRQKNGVNGDHTSLGVKVGMNF